MAQTENSAHMAEDWYLVANRNNLTIKIVKYITLGEDEAGLLVLDSRVEAERWLTLEVDPVGCLNVVYQDPRCRLTCPDRWVADSAGAVLPRCTMLELPNNKVYVSQQLQRGAVEQSVIVSCHNPTELEVANHFQLPPVSEVLPVDDTLADEPDADEPEDEQEEIEPPSPVLETFEVLEDTEPAANDHSSGLPDNLKGVVMAPEVLDAMLRQLEDAELSDAPISVDDIVLAQPEVPSSTATDEDIPLLQDVADVYSFSAQESAAQGVPPHAFEVVSSSAIPNTPVVEEPAPEPPAIESVYSRPGRNRSGKVFVLAVILILVAAGVVVQLSGVIDGSPQEAESPFMNSGISAPTSAQTSAQKSEW